MSEFQYNPVDGFKNVATFPDPTTQTGGREQIQSLMDQARDAINAVDTDLQADKLALTNHKTSSDHDGRYYTEAESDAKYALASDIQGIVLGQIPDGSLTDGKLSNDSTQIKGRFAAHQADYANYKRLISMGGMA